jgi:hypothetical protein
MWDWEEPEPPEEEWHSRINHEDQRDFVFPEPEPEPKPEPEPQVPPEPDPNGKAQYPFGVDPNTDPHSQQTPLPSFADEWMPRIRQFMAVPTNFYATLSIGFGILFGIAVAAISWHMTNPTGPYDLGSITSSAVGLKGHLYTKWDKNLQYRLSFEPTASEQLQGFDAAVESSPHPLSIGIQLTDAQGFVLCSKDILIKFDSRNAEPMEGQAEADKTPPDPQLQSSQATLAEAQEGAREQGKDIFQNQLGPNGQVVSISAQGELPCTASAYESAITWNFTPNFPSVSEQEALIHHIDEKTANAGTNSPAAIAARRRAAARAAANPPPKFYIEGEDAIVDYDTVSGIISTRGGKTFTIDRTGTEAASLKGRDFPLHVHYRCDQFGACTLYSAGAGVQHTRLRK